MNRPLRPGDAPAFPAAPDPPRRRERGSGRETHAPAAAWQQPGPPLAERARTARFAQGPCMACGQLLDLGQRIADLPASGGTIHVRCSTLITGRKTK